MSLASFYLCMLLKSLAIIAEIVFTNVVTSCLDDRQLNTWRVPRKLSNTFHGQQNQDP